MAEVKHLCIHNLPFSVTTDDLLQVVSRIAPGCTADVVLDRNSGRSKGFGFITAPTSAAAEILIDQLDGRTLGGRTLNVEVAEPREPRPRLPPLQVVMAVPIAELELRSAYPTCRRLLHGHGPQLASSVSRSRMPAMSSKENPGLEQARGH